MLALHAREVVSSDRLVDALWGERAPADAQPALHAHVSRLRKALEAPGVLVTRAPGYVLQIDDDQLDVRRFERLAEDGRAQLGAGEAEQAAATLRAALGLWRGPPLADLENEPFAAAAAPPLAEARLDAQETRIEADLARGEHAALVAELTELVRRHPLRERPRAQLMLALSRAGRDAEALEAYDEGRRTLADELGLAPGARLQGLQAEILAADPAPAPPRSPRPRPARAPARRRRRLLAFAVPAAAAALAAGALAAADQEPPRAAAPAAARAAGAALVRIDPGSGAVLRTVRAGTTPGAVATGAGAVWSIDVDAQTVTRVAADGEATTFGTGATPVDLAAGAGALWVAGGGPVQGTQAAGPVATTLARVDPATRTVRARIALPRRPGATTELAEDRIAVEPDAVWAIAPDFAVVRIDPRTDRVVATIRGLQARAVAAGDGGVWVLGLDGGIARIDRARNRVAVRGRIPASTVGALAVGAGSAWVAAPGDGAIWRVRPGPRLVMRTIDVDPGVGDLAFGAGALWAVNPLRGALVRVDPGTGQVARTIGVGGAPRAVAAGDEGVWVAVGGDRARPAAGTASSAPVHAHCTPTLYRGPGRPERLIVTDLPLQGGVRLSAQQMAQAAAWVLAERGFRAGTQRIGIQSCDDSIARTGLFDPARCAANARAYVADPRVLGVVGPVNSPCAVAALPELARAPGGPLAIVSPAASYAGLTRRVPGAPPGELARLHPGGVVHFARVFPTDDHQAVALAARADALGAERVAALDDGDLLYGRALADRFAVAARALGATVVARRHWAPEAADQRRLAAAVARTRPDAVFLGGLLDSGGAAVVRALRTALPAGTAILLPDGFTPTVFLAEQAGAAADGAYVAVTGLVGPRLPARGRAFAAAFGATLPGVEIEPTAVYAAEATGVLLDAIAGSGGSRAGVLDGLLATDREDGLTGPVRFDARGDVVAPAVTVLRMRPGARGPAGFPGTAIDRVVRAAAP
jgi:DNA-binding SARP family transcriptional activator/ABC-type branched-subunit amino acid transport system substrate-binding protein